MYRVLNRYTVLTFASDMCLAELVDDDNNPVPPGAPSAKVLVTNLHNLTQPLVRYELTDQFTGQEGTPAAGWLHASIGGRADEVFRYGSVAVHPHVIRSTLASEAAVREYQVRQTAGGIDVTCVTGSHLAAASPAAARTRPGRPSEHAWRFAPVALRSPLHLGALVGKLAGPAGVLVPCLPPGTGSRSTRSGSTGTQAA